MDIIISANDEIKKLINEIQLDDENKIKPEVFEEIFVTITKGKEKDEIQKI